MRNLEIVDITSVHSELRPGIRYFIVQDQDTSKVVARIETYEETDRKPDFEDSDVIRVYVNDA